MNSSTGTHACEKTKTVTELPSEQWSDERLLLEYRTTGNQQLFATLVHRYERDLYHYLFTYLGDAQLAEDTFQTTFMMVHLKCDQFDESRKVRPWLYRIATNRAIDNLRRNRRRRAASLDAPHDAADPDSFAWVDVLPGADEGPVAVLMERESSGGSVEALGRLPEHLRRVVSLVFFKGLKYREAAEVLSIPVGTVKSRMHTAISRLQDVLVPPLVS